MALAVGIDLGTTNSCVAVYRNDKVELILNDVGESITPSVVAFAEAGRLVGGPARSQAALNPLNTIYDVKRIIGRRLTEVGVRIINAQHLFQVVERNGRPVVQVTWRGGVKSFTPEEMTSMILSKMKSVAEGHLGHPVTSAVITVPATFNNAQRQATIDAASIAGLDVIRIMNEPTAAAAAFCLTNPRHAATIILIFAFGGGSCGVTLVKWDNGDCVVRASAGDSHLGGADIDDVLIGYFLQTTKPRFQRDLTSNARAMRRLRTACERAKRALSASHQTSIEIDGLHEGIDFYTTLTRATLETLCRDVFLRTLNPLKEVFNTSELKPVDVQEVVLVGGSSRIPMVQKLITSFFDSRELNKSVLSNEDIAFGAAFQAALMTGRRRIKDFKVVDVATASVGIEVAGGEMSPLIKHNTPIPVKISELFSTYTDNQSGVLVQVYEGENLKTKDNRLLGKFQLTGITPAPHGVPQIEVTFDVNADGILDVSAVEKSSGKSSDIQVASFKGSLPKEDITLMKAEAEQYRIEDMVEAKRISAMNGLEHLVYTLRTASKQSTSSYSLDKLDAEGKGKLMALIDETITWLDGDHVATADDYDYRGRTLEKSADAVMRTHAVKPRAAVEDSRRPVDFDPRPTSSPRATLSEETVRPTSQSPYRSVENRLEDLLIMSDDPAKMTYTEADFQHVSSLLRNTGRMKWSKVPRLYVVLRHIGHLQILDAFIDQGITDIWFPLTTSSLPEILTPSNRTSFLESQSLVLTKALELEKRSERTHAHFGRSEPLPFQVIARLGSGAYGDVEKVVSLLSHREYARKSFRRRRTFSSEKEDIKSFKNELQLLKKIDHMHCVALVSIRIFSRRLCLDRLRATHANVRLEL